MKQSQNGRRGRSRSGARKSGKGQDANRVEIKVRGNPKQLLEKYKNAARDAMQAGDRVLAEHNLQFADHYQRVLNEMKGLTRGLFSGDYVVVERADRTPEPEESADGDETTVTVEVAPAVADEQAEAPAPRRGRGRRRAPAQQEAQSDAAAPIPGPAPTAEDFDSGEQPPEVHPELDLSETGGDAPAKPRRRGRPRRTPAPAPASETVTEGDAA